MGRLLLLLGVWRQRKGNSLLIREGYKRDSCGSSSAGRAFTEQPRAGWRRNWLSHRASTPLPLRVHVDAAMALNKDALKILAPHLRGKEILSLGYPDLLLDASEANEILGVNPTKFTENGAWHGYKHKLPETQETFELLGSSIDCIDIYASRGVERIVDLNEPHDLGSYDLVIDAGTIEHCANIGQALMNAARAVKVGGQVFHTPPMSMLNHGFYNICPTLLYDFYTQNGWEIEHFTVWGGTFGWSKTFRFKSPSECHIFFLARKKSEGLKWPTQSKYLANPELKVANGRN